MLSFALTQNENEYLKSQKKNEIMRSLFLNPKVIFVNADYLAAEKKQLGGRIIREIQLAPNSYALVLG